MKITSLSFALLILSLLLNFQAFVFGFTRSVINFTIVGLNLSTEFIQIWDPGTEQNLSNQCMIKILNKKNQLINIAEKSGISKKLIENEIFFDLAKSEYGCKQEILEQKSTLNALERFVINIDNEVSNIALLISKTLINAKEEKWLIVFQNPAESRGTGGLLGFFGVVTIGVGKFEVDSFAANDNLPDFFPTTIDLPREFDELYGLNTSDIWLNDNVSPHYPYAAEVWLDKFSRFLEIPLSGVMVIDPIVVARILEKENISFEVQGTKINSSNFIEMTLYNPYIEYEERDEVRIQFLSELTTNMIESINFNELIKPSMYFAVNKSLKEGRIQIYSSDYELNKSVKKLNLYRDLNTNDEAVYISFNNLGENKLDYFLRAQISACTDAENEKISRHLISLRSEVEPERYLPGYMNRRGDILIGNPGPNSNRLLVGVYGSVGSTIENVKFPRNDQVVSKFQVPQIGTELGRPVYLIPMEVPAGRESINVLVEIRHRNKFSEKIFVTPLTHEHDLTTSARCI